MQEPRSSLRARSASPKRRASAPRAGVERELERLAAEIRSCRRCPLGSSRTQAVVYRGGATPQIVFVGEAPGVDEDRTGLPFVGRSGRLLDAAIQRLGLRAEEFGVLNVLKCHPPANRFDREAARTCRPFLDRQLALLRPVVLVPLGAVALRALDPSSPPVLHAAGTPRRGPGRTTLFPLVHPAASLRSRRLRERWDADVGALGSWLRSAAG